jgi:hypothetical protein
VDGSENSSSLARVSGSHWPSIRVHHIKLDGFIKGKQKFVIESAAKVKQDKFEQWAAAVKTATTGVAVTLAEYDEFESTMLADEPGGVRLDGKGWEPAKALAGV